MLLVNTALVPVSHDAHIFVEDAEVDDAEVNIACVANSVVEVALVKNAFVRFPIAENIDVAK